MAPIDKTLRRRVFGAQFNKMDISPRLKRTYADAFFHLNKVEFSESGICTIRTKIRKIDFDQAYYCAPFMLYEISRRMKYHCNFIVVLDRGQADLEIFEFDDRGHIILYKQIECARTFDNDQDARRELCNIALHWLLHEGPLERSQDRDGKGIPLDYYDTIEEDSGSEDELNSTQSLAADFLEGSAAVEVETIGPANIVELKKGQLGLEKDTASKLKRAERTEYYDTMDLDEERFCS
ncbi:uncharacterized protein LY89DRAFT_764047 [Mollisia scopiformis]|uniref:Uncharacterized protein n=1 Tax=Mollisia scopiformis TaxID=149040 RepID=A0A132B8J5_MOLSC|nr:uncharacterized protein LY89DRAFT_764047 [Mollisia scopiformis]KUJ08722.1 hypothetical protein LY89DRAFT_764047 [Mollisia scopiformis]